MANNIDRTKKILCHIFLRNHIPQPKGWITVMWGNVGFYFDAFVCLPQIAFSSPHDSLVQSSHLEVNKNIPPPSYESSLPENSISPHIKARYITLPHKYNPFRIQSKVTQKVTFFFPNSDVSQARAFKGQSSIRATLEACLSDDVGLQWLWGLAGSSHTWGIVKIRPPLLPLKSLIA